VVGEAGNGFDHLYGHYDAKVVGDYTGLTPPSPDVDNEATPRAFTP